MDFVFLSTQAWDEMGGAGRPTHYLAREALARAHRVLFIEVVASQAHAAEKNLTIVNFEALGYDEQALRRAWYGLDPRVDAIASVTRVLDAFETQGAERVVIYSDPFVPFVEWFALLRARGYKIVYDALDDFEAFPEIGLYFANRAAEQFLVAQSDVVVAVSTTLVEKLSAWAHRAPVQLLRQGFDPQTFHIAQKSDVISSPSPVLGFWGHVNAFNVDLPLVEYVARTHPDWTIQLIGPVDFDPGLPPVGPALRALPNVQLLGHVAHDQLPNYLQTFSVALIPFPANAFNRARDPLKVFEYLAGYKPVVSAHTPQLRGMPYVSIAETPAEFLHAIEHALTVPIDHAVLDAYLSECTWAKRFDQLERAVNETPPAPPMLAADTQAWYADTALAPNVREYLARTEELLQERTAFVRALENDARAKQTHIDRLQHLNPLWSLKSIIDQK